MTNEPEAISWVEPASAMGSLLNEKCTIIVTVLAKDDLP